MLFYLDLNRKFNFVMTNGHKGTAGKQPYKGLHWTGRPLGGPSESVQSMTITAMLTQ